METNIKDDIYFKVRFNTMHGDTDFYWRVIITTHSAELMAGSEAILKEGGESGELEYLARSVHCKVETWSEESWDARAGAVKYHMAGRCGEFLLDKEGRAYLM